jgi:hypothetical protein
VALLLLRDSPASQALRPGILPETSAAHRRAAA